MIMILHLIRAMFHKPKYSLKIQRSFQLIVLGFNLTMKHGYFFLNYGLSDYRTDYWIVRIFKISLHNQGIN